ncbi:RodZ domain-containing protein [Virgibacillus litoralis]|uniref:Cytoskeletal protein RodZ n=1 Tax=Virgibacillus litoralis TaxID=578221 RepID=A0ABS4HE45_9BACI|nr:RodZ domain-containing protein [Virgibacillus litoralis]MBP1949194.1 cytoskeletal protein RodZ [Virgibacillus litoralis]
MEIGLRLKEAREENKISLESLQETTKIQKRYLEAIEQGNFHILPGKFYARAFIKEYANAVGLDSTELLEEYKDEIPQTEAESSTQYTQIHRSRKDNNPTKNTAIFSFIPTIIVVLLVIGIVFAAWYFYQQTLSNDSSEPVDPQNDNEVTYNPDENNQDEEQAEDDNSDASSDETDEENNDSQAEEPEQPQPKLTVVEEGAGSRPESTLALDNASDNVTATLETSAKSWLEVENSDGESLFSGMFTADDSPLELDLSEAERVWFRVGSAPDLSITIDGVEVKYPVDENEYVLQKLWININKASAQSN